MGSAVCAGGASDETGGNEFSSSLPKSESVDSADPEGVCSEEDSISWTRIDESDTCSQGIGDESATEAPAGEGSVDANSGAGSDACSEAGIGERGTTGGSSTFSGEAGEDSRNGDDGGSESGICTEASATCSHGMRNGNESPVPVADSE